MKARGGGVGKDKKKKHLGELGMGRMLCAELKKLFGIARSVGRGWGLFGDTLQSAHRNKGAW